jgi:hypothetical protein
MGNTEITWRDLAKSEMARRDGYRAPAWENGDRARDGYKVGYTLGSAA